MPLFGYGPLADLALVVFFLGLALLFLAGALGFTDHRKLAYKTGEAGLAVLYISFTFFIWFYPGVAWTLHSLTGRPELVIDWGVILIGLGVALAYEHEHKHERAG